MPPVKIFAFLEIEQNWALFKGLLFFEYKLYPADEN
jgi:hypothetical protein